jgi:calmodulin
MSPPVHDHRREVQAHFIQADADGDKRIDRKEFRALLTDLEADMSPEESEIGFDEIDTDNDGLIDFDEFLAWWQEA